MLLINTVESDHDTGLGLISNFPPLAEQPTNELSEILNTIFFMSIKNDIVVLAACYFSTALSDKPFIEV